MPGHVEELGRGLLSPSVGLTCSNSLLADQKHLHFRDEGKLVVCNKPVVTQNQRVSVIVLNPQRKVCAEPQTFSPVKSEINGVENGAQTPHINLVEDEAVISVDEGGVNNWYTCKPEYAVCKPCSTGSYEPPRDRVNSPTRGNDNLLESLITTVNKSRPSDFIEKSCLESIESGIQTGLTPGCDSLAAHIPKIASTLSSFIDLKNASSSQGPLSIQTGRHRHTQQQVLKSELDRKLAPSHNSPQVKNVPTNNIHQQGGNLGIVVQSCHIESTRRSLQSDRPLAILRSKPRSSKTEQSAGTSQDLAYLHRFLPDKLGRDIGISHRGNLVRKIRHNRKYAKKTTINPPNSSPPIFRYGGLYYSNVSNLSAHTLSGAAVRSASNFNSFFSRSGKELPLDVNCLNKKSEQEGEESVVIKHRPLNFDRG